MLESPMPRDISAAIDELVGCFGVAEEQDAETA
jgi:hypothetical protein